MLDGTLLIKRDGLTLPSAPRAVALRGTRLVAVSADGGAIVADCDAEGRWHLERRLGLEGAPAHIALGRSGRLLLSRPETRDRASVSTSTLAAWSSTSRALPGGPAQP